jgi:hypothetical protein
MPFYTIKEAIRSGRRLKLSLAEGEYLVEPHVLGRNRGARRFAGPSASRSGSSGQSDTLDSVRSGQHSPCSRSRRSLSQSSARIQAERSDDEGGIIEYV